MHRLIGGSGSVLVLAIGVAVAVISFMYLDSYVGDPAADASQSVEIIYDTTSDVAAAPPPAAMTELMDLQIWLGMLSINLGLAAAIVAGVIVGGFGWRRKAAELPPIPTWWPTVRSLLYALLLVGGGWLMMQRTDAIGALALQPPLEPETLVPRVFRASGQVTVLGLGAGFLGTWALLWLREVAATEWNKGVDQRRVWTVELRGIATPLLAGLSLMIVAAMFATGSLVNVVELAFGDAITVVDGVAVLFGSLLSAMLALAYLPTHAALERQARLIVDEVAPVELDPLDKDALARRKLASGVVKAGTAGRSSLEENLLIAGPLLSSLVTLILK